MAAVVGLAVRSQEHRTALSCRPMGQEQLVECLVVLPVRRRKAVAEARPALKVRTSLASVMGISADRYSRTFGSTPLRGSDRLVPRLAVRRDHLVVSFDVLRRVAET